ncbi:MAG: hypothetical protein WC747_01870 [Candidatus Babeliales bacterium]|jgi:hypothetical protein
MFKKLSLMMLALLCESQCAASFSKKPNSVQLQRAVIRLSERDLDEEIVFRAQPDDIHFDSEIIKQLRVVKPNIQGVIPGENEENFSCWEWFGPCLVSCCAVFYCGWLEPQDNKIK